MQKNHPNLTNLTQANHYLSILQGMDAANRRAFLKIYRLAPHSSHPKRVLSGHHVRLAMIEALTHPGLAYWVRMNLSVRVAKKLAETTGRLDKAARLSETLEAFHVAADAFVYNISTEAARQARQERHSTQPRPIRMLPARLNVVGVSAEEVALIETFKAQLIPNLARTIRRGHKPEPALMDRQVMHSPF